MSDERPPIRIPENKESAEELALEGDEEETRVSEEQRCNIAIAQAKLIGDIADE